MCKCTPSIRTPYCGKLGCEWPKPRTSLIERAHDFALLKHAGQLDDGGLDYFEQHILNVVKLVRDVKADEEVVAAAYLHDTIEDTGTTQQELVANFGATIANLVMEVTHDGEKDTYGRYFPRLETQNGIIIKFADRLSSVSRMQPWDEKRKAHYLKKSKFWKTDPINETKDLTRKLKSILKHNQGETC